MRSEVAEIVGILERVRAIVRATPQILDWQRRYDEVDELVADLDQHVARLRQDDLSGLRELGFMFAPTGSFCEIAASSGWLDEYTELGNRFDGLHARLTE